MEVKPSPVQLYSGCLLASIAHAVHVCQNPDFSYTKSWEGSNYSVQDSMGTFGTISFTEHGCLGAFRDESCSRDPYSNPERYDIEVYLGGMPEGVRADCEAITLTYLLDDLGNTTQPVITTAFWEENGELKSNDIWEDIVAYGGHAIRIECLPIEEAIREWETEYALSHALVELTANVYAKKIASAGGSVTLTEAEYQTLLASSVPPEGIVESRTSFSEIGVRFPGE
jgi:hypothetical protein